MTTTEQPTTRAETFECDGPVELDLQIAGGRIEVRATDAKYVRVELAIEQSPQPGWERGLEELIGRVSAGEYTPSLADAHVLAEVKVTFSEQRRRLVVRSPRALRRIGLAVVVEAPKGSRLVAAAHRASVTAAGALATLKASTGTGDVTAERVDGDAHVRVGSGDVSLGRVSGTVSIQDGSGEVEVASIDGEAAKVTTGRGDIWLGAVRANVHVRTGNGNVVIAEAASGALDIAAGSGDVRVAVLPGISAVIDVSTGRGEARSDLEVADAPPAEKPQLLLRARTGAGDAIVTRAL